MSDLEEAARIYDKMLLDDIERIKYIQHKLESIRTVLSTKNGQIRELREAVIKERAVMSMMRRECVHAYEGVQPGKDCLDSAERELRAEGVIE